MRLTNLREVYVGKYLLSEWCYPLKLAILIDNWTLHLLKGAGEPTYAFLESYPLSAIEHIMFVLYVLYSIS